MEPGFWERIFLGHDANGNGTLDAGEKGILPSVADFMSQVGMQVLNGPMNYVTSLAPNSEAATIATTVKQALFVVNQWVPVSELIIALIYFFTAYIALCLVHLILKLIPGIW